MEPQRPYIIKEDYDIPVPEAVELVPIWMRANITPRQVCELERRIRELERQAEERNAWIGENVALTVEQLRALGFDLYQGEDGRIGIHNGKTIYMPERNVP